MADDPYMKKRRYERFPKASVEMLAVLKDVPLQEREHVMGVVVAAVVQTNFTLEVR